MPYLGIRSLLLQKLWRAQQGLCFHCGELMLVSPSHARPLSGRRWSPGRRWSREHVYPRSGRGANMLNNIVLAHQDCNSARGNLEPTDDEITRTRALYALIGEVAFLRFGPAGTEARSMPGRTLTTLAEFRPGGPPA